MTITILALLLTARGGSKAAQSTVAADRTTPPTMAPLPKDVQETTKSVFAWGESSGVRWFFSEGFDAEMGGQCYGFDSDPPLRPYGSGKNLDPPLVLIGSTVVCRDSPIAFRRDFTDVGDPISVIENETSDDGRFSVFAGIAAKGAHTVRVVFPDGTEATQHPDARGAFLVVSRPPKPKPDSLVVSGPSGEVRCDSDKSTDDPDYFCPPRMTAP
jgi:hypothetical protein